MNDEVTHYLYQALASRWGIVVSANDLPNLRSRLYIARRAAMKLDPEIARLQLRPSIILPEEELWIIKGELKDGQRSESIEQSEGA